MTANLGQTTKKWWSSMTKAAEPQPMSNKSEHSLNTDTIDKLNGDIRRLTHELEEQKHHHQTQLQSLHTELSQLKQTLAQGDFSNSKFLLQSDYDTLVMNAQLALKLSQEQEEKVKHLEDLTLALQHAKDHSVALEKKIAFLNEEKTMAVESMKQLTTVLQIENADIKSQMSNLQNDAVAQSKLLREELSRLQTELQHSQSAKCDLESILKNSQSVKTELESQLKNAQSAQLELESQLKNAQSAQLELESQFKNAQSAQLELESQLKNALIAKQELESQLKSQEDHPQKEKEHLNPEFKEQSGHDMEAQWKQKEAQWIEEQAKQLKEHEEKRKDFESRLNELEQLNRSLHQTIDELQVKVSLGPSENMDQLAKEQLERLLQDKKESHETIHALNRQLKEQQDAFKDQLDTLHAKMELQTQSVKDVHSKEIEHEKTEYRNRIQDLEQLLEKTKQELHTCQSEFKIKTDRLSQLEPQLAAYQKEMDQFKKKQSQDKEAQGILVQTLQERIQQAQIDKMALEKQLKIDTEERLKKEQEKFKKEKVELEDRHKKDKNEQEERHKKDKIEQEEKLKKERTKWTNDLDKLKKDMAQLEQQKSELHKTLIEKTKTFDSEVLQWKQQVEKGKSEHSIAFEEQLKKIRELEQQLKDHEASMKEIEELREAVQKLNNGHEILAAELEVAKASNERSSKNLQEKDDLLKKLKQRNDELNQQESQSKRLVSRIEKERDELKQELHKLKEEQVSCVTTTVNQIQQLEHLEKMKKDTEQSLQSIQQEKDTLEQKLTESERQLRQLEKKNAALSKDLQRYISKEKKHEQDPSPTSSSGSGQLLNRQGETKGERLTDDVLQPFHGVYRAEDVQTLHEKLSKLSEENEQKSKVIQQYILRDNAKKLQLEEAQIKPALNLNLFSTANSLSKLDPQKLSQINLRLQRLLEETTTRMMLLEDQIKQMATSK